MDILSLAIRSRLPLIYVRTDDTINVQDVLAFIAGEKVTPVNLPEVINKPEDLKLPSGTIYFTSSECKSLTKLYRLMVDEEKTIIFVNTERSVLQFDGGTLVPPKELVLQTLKEMEVCDNPEELLPAFGGLTLKDVGEIAKLTMTRDNSITPRGVNETRRGYNKLQGISQVDTEQGFYVCPQELQAWMKINTPFFMSPKHPSLTPRGLLFDGPPGTGKTLASKYIAQTFGVPLYRLDLGAMMGKYVGESEGNLNAALAQVDEVEPCVIIFDEVEKVFQASSDSGVTSRLLSQLLWWLQEHKSKVFTVMTTNNKSTIPVELYREGRIDKVFNFLGIDDEKEAVVFAKGAFDAMLAEMGATLDDAGTKQADTKLRKSVRALFVGQGAVPQTKITQAVYSLVRDMLSGVQSDDTPAEPEVVDPPSGGVLKVVKSGGKPKAA